VRDQIYKSSAGGATHREDKVILNVLKEKSCDKGILGGV